MGQTRARGTLFLLVVAALAAAASGFAAQEAALPELQVPPLPAGSVSQIPLERALTLSEAISIALYAQPQLALARYTAEAARGRVRQAESGYFPTVDISAAHTRTGPNTGGGVGTTAGGAFTSGGYTTSFSGRELIWDSGATPASVGQARSQAESARRALAQARLDTINRVKQAYYTLLQNQELLGVQRQNVDDQQAHLNLAKARFEAGTTARADVVRAEAAVADAVLNLASAQNAVAAARVTLNLSLGMDVRTPTRVEETQERGPAELDAATLVEQGLADRPAMEQSRADVEAAREALRGARASNRPGLFLNGSYGLRGSSFPPGDRSWSYGVSMSWPLLNVGLTAGRVQESVANLLGAETRLRQTELSVGSEVVQGYLSVQTARQKVTAAEAEVASAEESLRLATGRYETGVAVYIEVIDAETAALTARTNLVNGRYALSTSLAALEAALGLEQGE